MPFVSLPQTLLRPPSLDSMARSVTTLGSWLSRRLFDVDALDLELSAADLPDGPEEPELEEHATPSMEHAS